MFKYTVSGWYDGDLIGEADVVAKDSEDAKKKAKKIFQRNQDIDASRLYYRAKRTR